MLASKLAPHKLPLKVLSKKLSSVECTSLNGANFKTHQFGRFRARQASQIAVENDDPQVLSKLANCLKQCRPTFGFVKDFFRRRPPLAISRSPYP